VGLPDGSPCGAPRCSGDIVMCQQSAVDGNILRLCMKGVCLDVARCCSRLGGSCNKATGLCP
jgi:hypothetical protein